MPLRSQGYCGAGTRLLGLHWVSCNGRGPNLEWRQEPQRSSRDFTGAGLIRIAKSLQSWDRMIMYNTHSYDILESQI